MEELSAEGFDVAPQDCYRRWAEHGPVMRVRMRGRPSGMGEAAKPMEFAGTRIPARHFVDVIDAANRDSRRFTQPELFEPSAESSGHIAFVHGIHHCIGAPLASLPVALS